MSTALKDFITKAMIYKAMKGNKFWRFRSWRSKVFWLTKFELYQDPTRMKFGLGFDWSEQPIIIELNIIFWSLEISIYKNKKEIY